MAGKLNGGTRSNVVEALESGDMVLDDEGSVAIAQALKYMEPGQQLVLHEDTCSKESENDDDDKCDCNCLTLVAGASS